MPSLVRALVASLALVLAGGCAGFGGGSDHDQKPAPTTHLAKIIETGKLRVGMSGEQPPLNMTSKTGELVGLEVALARVLGAAIGVQVELVKIPFPKLLDALEADQIDLIMSGMTITAARNLRVVFVGPYFISGQSLLSKSTELLAASVDQLNRPDVRLAALTSSTSEAWAKRAVPRATLIPTQTLDAGIQLVISNQADALVADQEVCYFAMLRHKDVGLAVRAENFTVEPIGIALPPDDHQLTNLISNYLGALEMQGTLARARTYWFEDESWVGSIQ
jgi:polar amino acid transport system substrate-binding protein